MKRLWLNITENEDGTPLFGCRWGGPIVIAIGIIGFFYQLLS